MITKTRMAYCRKHDIYPVMTRTASSPRRYKRAAFCLGLFAMVLQSLMGISHMGALAASAMGNTTSLTGPFGLMQICTPRGIVVRAPDTNAPAQRSSAGQPCPLCSASVFAGFICSSAHVTSAPAFYGASDLSASYRSVEVKHLENHEGLPRAPPA